MAVSATINVKKVGFFTGRNRTVCASSMLGMTKPVECGLIYRDYVGVKTLPEFVKSYLLPLVQLGFEDAGAYVMLYSKKLNEADSIPKAYESAKTVQHRSNYRMSMIRLNDSIVRLNSDITGAFAGRKYKVKISMRDGLELICGKKYNVVSFLGKKMTLAPL